MNSARVPFLRLPYRAPSDIDLPRLISMVNSLVAQYERRIWELREDAAFFAEQFRSQLCYSPASWDFDDTNALLSPLKTSRN